MQVNNNAMSQANSEKYNRKRQRDRIQNRAKQAKGQGYYGNKFVRMLNAFRIHILTHTL